jgi:hypothetical protein
MFFTNPDLKKMRAADINMMSSTLASSAHVPVTVEGRPGTLNFWSKQKNAFAKDQEPLLRALAQAALKGH